MRAVIGIGTNLGDREQYIANGLEALEKRAGHIVKRSSVIETKAYGVTDQPDFLNMAVILDTKLPAEELLYTLLQIEKEQHRKRIIHWGPRTLDLALIYYGEEIIHSDVLIVPHPDRCNREFVLAPIAEMEPDFVDPELHQTVGELLAELHNRE